MNYFEIIRSYNEFLIAKQVGAKANSLFYALIGKSNTLRFPTKLTIYNSELRDLSGLSKDELNPARNKLTQVQINDQYLVKYRSKGTRKPGDYWLNYEGLSSYFQNNPAQDWSCIPIKDKPHTTPDNDYSDNTSNPDANLNTNHGSNDDANSQRLIGKSDALLTDCNEPNGIKELQQSVSRDRWFDEYFQCFGKAPNSMQCQDITVYLDQDGLEDAVICKAFQMAARNGKSYGYAVGILNNWCSKGIKTIAAVEVEQKQFQSSRRTKSKAFKEHQEVVPEWMKNKAKSQPAEPQVSPEEAEQRSEYLKKYLGSI